MRIYKELSFVGDKATLDKFKECVPSYAKGDWKYCATKRLKDYISFVYNGDMAEKAEVSIFYGEDTWRQGYVKVENIVPLIKPQLTIEEYNAVLDLFFTDIIQPNIGAISGLEVVGPESDLFDPLKYISSESLDKLSQFCDLANKTTGSSHPCDEMRWFDFICQTVDDNQVFDHDTLYRFLMDEEYWGKKPSGFVGVMGHFAWDKEHAFELATEYENYVRFLKRYKNRRKREYEDIQE